jgi:threonyl-tRNA synthetase
MLVIGDKEVETASVSPRFRDGSNLQSMSPKDFADHIMNEAASFR